MWWKAREAWSATGLPQGDVIYTDTGTWFPQAEAMYSAEFQLSGKPDYIIQQADGMLIPVEVKSKKAPSNPHDGHVMQVAAYCLLIADNYGIRPSHGVLQYRDKAFAIDYNEDLEADLFDVLVAMREDMFADEVDRNHENWHLCARCNVRGDCFQRLA